MNITRLKLPALRAFVESQQWAIHRERGAALLELLEARANGIRPAGSQALGPIDLAKRDFEARASERRPITKSGGAIAVLPLYGVIAQRMDLMMALCGGTSTEAFADVFDAAMADPNISAIVIDCDSPGGSVTGTPELAKRILNARGKGKEIVAVANGMMASAAYWICSAADTIVATPSAEGVGSIGVFCVHVDQSGMNEQLGLKYSLIKAGEHKAETNPWEPLSADAEAFVQGQVDEMYSMFVAAVAKQRAIDAKTVEASFGQGRTFTAKQALAAGMIDRVATLEDTLKRLGAKNVGASGRPQPSATANARLAATTDSTPADETAPPDPADPAEDDELCPDCGAPLDDAGDCTSCDYTVAATAPALERAASATSVRIIGALDAAALQAALDATPRYSLTAPAGAGAADRRDPPDSHSAQAEEPTMDEAVKAALEAERKRAASIRALGRDHQIDAAKIDKMIDDGASVDAARAVVLDEVKARQAASPTIIVGADREADRKFESLGEQLVSIVARTKHGRRDTRLERVNANAMRADREGALDMMAGSPSGMNESVSSEGGFFIAPEVLPGIMSPIYADDPILSRVTRIPIGSSSNRTVYNVVDESARTDGNRWGGIQMFWGDEADQAAPKKPKMRQVEQVLKKLLGLAYLTDEMTVDAPASQALLEMAFQAESRFTVGNVIFRGSGGGQPLGFLKGKGGVVQAIEAGQTIANSPASIALNVTKMKSNIPAALWGDLIWLYNQELLPYLMTSTVGAGGAAVPVFISAGGFGNAGPTDRILGAPAFASELAEAVGTPGDLIAIAPSQYHLAEKGGAQIATSVHVKFLTDELTLRITQRLDGKPVWNTTVAPFKGANQRGFFSTLNTRA